MLNKKKPAQERQSKSVKEQKKKENVQRIDIRNDSLYEQTKDKRKKEEEEKDRLNQMTAVHKHKDTISIFLLQIFFLLLIGLHSFVCVSIIHCISATLLTTSIISSSSTTTTATLITSTITII